MPDMIVFEELGEGLTTTIDGSSELVVTGHGLVGESVVEWIYGFGQILLYRSNVGTAVEDVTLIVGFGVIPFAPAYSATMPVDECEGFGEVPLYGAGTTEDTLLLGLGELMLTGEATVVGAFIPPGDEPFIELYEWLLVESQDEVREILSAHARFDAGGGVIAQGTYKAAINELLTANTQLRVVLEAVLSDSAVASAVLAGDKSVVTAITDALQLSGEATSLVSALALLADALALAGSARSVIEEELLDAAELADALEASARALEALVSTVVVDAMQQGLAVLSVLVHDSLEVEDELTPQASLLAALEESIGLSLSLTLDGVPYLGIAMNTETRGVTEYGNYNFSGLAEYGDTMYGVGPAGLYQLEGETDAGAEIDAFVRTALLRLGAGKEVRIDSAYLGYRSDGTLQLKVTHIDSRGSKRGYVYDLQELPAADNRPGRIKVGKGLKSVYWSFELSNTDGADFDLDMLEIFPLVLNRRLP